MARSDLIRARVDRGSYIGSPIVDLRSTATDQTLARAAGGWTEVGNREGLGGPGINAKTLEKYF